MYLFTIEWPQLKKLPREEFHSDSFKFSFKNVKEKGFLYLLLLSTYLELQIYI